MTNPNGPINPVYFYHCQPHTGEQVVRDQFPGMTIREHFASLALPVLMTEMPTAEAAIHAVKAADLLIEALNRKSE